MSVFHVPKVAIAFLVVPMALQEEVLGQFEDDRKQDEQLVDNLVMDVPSKLLYNGPVVLDELRMLLSICRDELRYVIDLGVLLSNVS